MKGIENPPTSIHHSLTGPIGAQISIRTTNTTGD